MAVLGDDDLSGGSLFSAGRSPPRKFPIDFQRRILKVSIRNWPRDIQTTFPLILKGLLYCFNIEFGQGLSKLKFY